MIRAGYIDAARGFAILLILVGHAAVVPTESGIQSPALLTGAWEFFKPFRIPLLFFLSGSMLPRSLRKGNRTYLYGKFKNVLWPLIVWAIVRYIPDIYSGHPFKFSDLIAPGYLWFLSFLFWYYVLALALKKVPYWVTATVLLVSSFLLDGWADKFAFHAGFFFLGAAIVGVSPNFIFMKVAWVRSVCVVVAITAGTFSILSPGYDVPHLAFPAIMACIFAAIGVFQWLDEYLSLTFLRWVGRNSIVFYVSHMPAIAATMVLVTYIELVQGWAVWILCVSAALGIGVIGTLLRNVTIVSLLFEFPRTKRISRMSTK